MTLSRLARSQVATIEPSCTVSEAARLMTILSVGALLIVEPGTTRPTGIITDRDLVKMIGEGLDPRQTTVATFSGSELRTASAGDSPRQLLSHMRRWGIRRLPILREDGALAGIVTLDDLLVELSEELGEIAAAIRREFEREDPVPPGAHERTL